jgi:TonB family protein
MAVKAAAALLIALCLMPDLSRAESAQDAAQCSEASHSAPLPDFLYTTLHLGPADYPPQILAKGEQGTAHVVAIIGSNNRVACVFVTDSSGFPDLDAASLDFVKGVSEVSAARLNGKPMQSILALSLMWSLNRDATIHAPAPESAVADPTLVKRGAVLFEHDSTYPTPSQLDGIRLLSGDVVNALDAGATKVVLFGYGGAAGNISPEALSIGFKRATALRELMVDYGVPKDRIEVHAMGGADDGGVPDRVDIFIKRD